MKEHSSPVEIEVKEEKKKKIPVEFAAGGLSFDYDDPSFFDMHCLKFAGSHYEGKDVQDIKHPSLGTIITTAHGVAPSGLSGKCLWLRGPGVEWELIKYQGKYILIPSLKTENEDGD